MCDGTWWKVVVGAEWRGYWWCIGHCLLLCECADLWLKTDERERETDRQTDRQTDKQTDRDTHTQRQRETQTDRKSSLYMQWIQANK